MAKNEAFYAAEKKIAKALRTGATELDLSGYSFKKSERLTELPESLGQLKQLQSLYLESNQLASLPESLGQLKQLQSLYLWNNQLTSLPESLGQLKQLQALDISANRLTLLPESIARLESLKLLSLGANRLKEVPMTISKLRSLLELALGDNYFVDLPDWLGELFRLKELRLQNNRITDIPASFAQLERLKHLDLDDNPLNPELAAAYKEGLGAVMRYLRAKAEAQVVLNEAKLILIGEGEVGKSCLLGALRGDPWEEGKPTTHGIEIKPVKVNHNGTEITLNGWDFGGQRVYRPTHQLFFTAPAVYLVVWKPREGPQQGFVKEWIKLVKHREPEAKILVVATHGGPKERQPDIDRQEIWDLFGRETVVDFISIDSKPNENGERPDIEKLKTAIAKVAASLPEMGRTFPKHWQDAREALRQSDEAWLPLDRVFAICKEHKVEEEDARLLLRICRRVGDLIHYEHDPTLRNIVILKPDWLATAISFVLDDEQTRNIGHGLVSFERLGLLWNDPERPTENRYPADLHTIFLRLMERFDLCYRVAEIGRSEADGTSLIAQLVPDVRPESIPGWGTSPATGDEQQVQICRIVEAAKSQSANAEGIFYQLIVRLHKYSLGRIDYKRSVHWQRGLLLQDNYGARAFLEHIANDIRITVRSPYPERFLAALTYEIKWLVESFWEGLHCEVTVPCLAPQPSGKPCIGLFEVGKLLENKRRNRPEQPCPICNEWQNIEQLLHNAPASRPNPLDALLSEFITFRIEVAGARQQLISLKGEAMERFDKLDIGTQRILSRVDDGFTNLMHSLNDDAREGPRLFSFEPVERKFFNPKEWSRMKFRLTLWCEHSRLPLPALNGEGSKQGVCEIELTRAWFKKAVPFLKVLTSTLSLVLPVASSGIKLALDDTAYKAIENQLDFGKEIIDASLKGGENIGAWLGGKDASSLERGEIIRAQGGILRELHSILKKEDPSFGGLIRVQNKRQEFLWVHPMFEGEY